ncbi:hypothetical protein Dsin_021037 [Dipteronia sinensis]|uniref:Endonuclease/exonuclease/phosphatase domain-containing protein n=1 Tax=Dipteronia sinensis TaxID=43782 RepID=A0AAE0AAG3_9ROSI|nr:hypothetical protein Dsin_021037 [Dipteronia sinensis]
MKILAWNARGLGSSLAFNTLRSHKQDSKPEMMFLVQTRCQHATLENWRIKLGFSVKLVVNSVGKSRGICLFWSDLVSDDLMTYSQEHIEVQIRSNCKQSWRFTGFYGHSDLNQRRHSWTLLRRLSGMYNLPWVCMGDINEVFWDQEKSGGLKKKWRAMT